MADLKKLKKQIDVVAVIGARVQLHQQGSHYMACCPFHGENTPSFKLDDRQGEWLWKCFGCGVGGDVIEFVEKFDHCDTKTAIEKMEALVGNTEWREEAEKVRKNFSELGQMAGGKKTTIPLDKWEAKVSALWNSPPALAYLQETRGLDDETIRRLKFGFVQTHVYNIGEGNEEFRDKGWIAIPRVEGDKVVAVKLRSIASKIFSQVNGMDSRALFNIETVTPIAPVYVTEGEFDAAVLEMLGFNAVSLTSASSTVSTDDRIKLKKAERIFLAGDSDEAGLKSMAKLLRELCENTHALLWPDGVKDANDYFRTVCVRDKERARDGVLKLSEEAKRRPPEGFISLVEALRTSDGTDMENDPDRLYLPAQLHYADRMSYTTRGGIMLLYSTASGTGKALSHGTPIATPQGWRVIEDIRVGDKVIGANGDPTEVLGVYPQGLRDLFDVKFTCGTVVTTDGDHQWTVERNGGSYDHCFVRTTRQLMVRSLGKYRVPLIAPVNYQEKDLPLHPYLLGVLLGDGGLIYQTDLTSADQEILDRVSSVLPPDVKIVSNGTMYGYRISVGRQHKGFHGNRPNPVTDALIDLGLHGHSSLEKFIPSLYMFSSVDQRLELLRGLLDTDGTVDARTCAVTFNTSSPRLRDDIRELIFSLGMFAGVSPRKTDFAPAWNISVNADKGIRLFHLTRKHIIADQRKGWRRQRFIESITPAGNGKSTCIRVAAPDSLYLTKDYIPTHNSMLKTDILLSEAKRGQVVVDLSPEIRDNEYLSLVTSQTVGPKIGGLKRTGKMDKKYFLQAADILDKPTAKGTDFRYYVGHNIVGQDEDEVVGFIESTIRTLGATRFAIDTFHRLVFAEGKSQAVAEGNLAKKIENLGRKYGTIFIFICQSNAEAEGIDNLKKNEHGVLRGSRELRDVADTIYLLHRNRRTQKDGENPEDILEKEAGLFLKKTRYKGTSYPQVRMLLQEENSLFVEIGDTTQQAPQQKSSEEPEFMTGSSENVY